MFGKNDKSETPVKEAPQSVTRSHIAEGMLIKGDIEGDIDIFLEGRLEGNLRCRSVTIGKSGEINGGVVAQEALIDGKVVGNVEAKIVKLNATAQMIGDVSHDVIEVSGGARIEGRYGRIGFKDTVTSVAKASEGFGIQAAKEASPPNQPKTPPTPSPTPLPTPPLKNPAKSLSNTSPNALPKAPPKTPPKTLSDSPSKVDVADISTAKPDAHSKAAKLN